MLEPTNRLVTRIVPPLAAAATCGIKGWWTEKLWRSISSLFANWRQPVIMLVAPPPPQISAQYQTLAEVKCDGARCSSPLSSRRIRIRRVLKRQSLRQHAAGWLRDPHKGPTALRRWEILSKAALYHVNSAAAGGGCDLTRLSHTRLPHAPGLTFSSGRSSALHIPCGSPLGCVSCIVT